MFGSYDDAVSGINAGATSDAGSMDPNGFQRMFEGMGDPFGPLDPGSAEAYRSSLPGTGTEGMTENGRHMFDTYFNDVVARLNEQRAGGGKLDYYQQLGQQLMSALAGPKGQAQGQGQAEGGNPYSGDSLAQGFDPDWLSQRLSAGSANGAKIGGMSMGKGGK